MQNISKEQQVSLLRNTKTDIKTVKEILEEFSVGEIKKLFSDASRLRNFLISLKLGKQISVRDEEYCIGKRTIMSLEKSRFLKIQKISEGDNALSIKVKINEWADINMEPVAVVGDQIFAPKAVVADAVRYYGEIAYVVYKVTIEIPLELFAEKPMDVVLLRRYNEKLYSWGKFAAKDISRTQFLDTTVDLIGDKRDLRITVSPNKRLFPYLASVVIPCYNVAKTLERTLKSVVTQSINKKLIQVICVNDGSTDNTLGILEQYARAFDFIEVHSQPNGGLSAARNTGIRLARGKYIFYLDSDDEFTPSILEKVCAFFDEHYDEVDLVAFGEKRIHHSGKVTTPPRYKDMKTGIYSLDETNFCVIRVSVAVKNKLEDNIFFRYKGPVEDQVYCCDILRDKASFGYVDRVGYVYYQDNYESIMKDVGPTLSRQDDFLASYYDLFEAYENVPKSFQRLAISHLTWTLSALLYPYDPIFNKKFSAILSKIDPKNVLDSPEVDGFHKHYYIANYIKPQFTILAAPAHVVVRLMDDSILLWIRQFECIIRNIKFRDGKMLFKGFIKSPLYNYVDEAADVYYTVDDENYTKLPVTLALYSHYQNKYVKTNNFWMFECWLDLEAITSDGDAPTSVKIKVKFGDVYYPVKFWGWKSIIFSDMLDKKLVYDDFVIDFDFDEGVFDIGKGENVDKLIAKAYAKKPAELAFIKNVYKLKKTRKIWLYSDMNHVKKDNGYYQYINDYQKQDGIERYYVSDFSQEELEMTHEQYKNVIPWHGGLHELYYYACEKIISSFTSAVNGGKTIFLLKNEYNFLEDFDVIYLQHGILHTSYKRVYHKDVLRCEKIVVSSQFEIDNLSQNYGYDKEQLIVAGQPRYELLNTKQQPLKKILFAPSWRLYFAQHKDVWRTLETSFLKSNYYKNFSKFLQSPRLDEMLKKHGYELVFKPHPIIKDAGGLFDVNSDYVSISFDTEVTQEDFEIFITDFSSYVFDFVYLGRKIMYFVPDITEFEKGLHAYAKLDLPWEEAFGNLTLNPDDALDELERLLDGNYSETFVQRQKDFFLPQKNNCERIYQAIMEENK